VSCAETEAAAAVVTEVASSWLFFLII